MWGDAPQGGLSCRCAAIHLLAIPRYYLQNCTTSQSFRREIATGLTALAMTVIFVFLYVKRAADGRPFLLDSIEFFAVFGGDGMDFLHRQATDFR